VQGAGEDARATAGREAGATSLLVEIEGAIGQRLIYLDTLLPYLSKLKAPLGNG